MRAVVHVAVHDPTVVLHEQHPNLNLRLEYLNSCRATALRSEMLPYHLFLDLEHQVKHINVCRGPMLQALLYCTVHQHRLPCPSTHKTGFGFPRAYAYAKLRHNIVLLICRIVVIGAPS